MLHHVKRGRNVLITGSGGVGKSVLVKHIMRWLAEQEKPYAATAPTGVAALNIEGTTFHTWSGIGVPEEYGDFLKAWGKNGARDRIEQAHVLLIDEVSMVSGEMLDCLELALAYVRQYGRFKEWKDREPYPQTLSFAELLRYPPPPLKIRL